MTQQVDLSEGCNHCDAEPGEPCDVKAFPHERHVKCSVLRCTWRYARVAYQCGPYELGYLTAAREIVDGVASHVQAKERGLYPLESNHRIDWDRGYDACVCAHMLGHDIEAMIEQAVFEPSTMTTASVVFNLIEGWPRDLREDPRCPKRVRVEKDCRNGTAPCFTSVDAGSLGSQPKSSSSYSSIEVVPAPRPENDLHDFEYKTYHKLLDHLCTELGVPGSQSFWEAVAYVKRKLGRESRD